MTPSEITERAKAPHMARISGERGAPIACRAHMRKETNFAHSDGARSAVKSLVSALAVIAAACSGDGAHPGEDEAASSAAEITTIGCSVTVSACFNAKYPLGTRNDAYGGAATNRAACASRAGDIYRSCQNDLLPLTALSDNSVVSRFFDARGTLTQTTSYPASDCVVTLGACWNGKVAPGSHFDAYGGANSDPAACKRRAIDLYKTCQNDLLPLTLYSDNSVMSVYHANGASSVNAYPASGCVIEVPSCRNGNIKLGTYFENYNGAMTDERACLSRSVDIYRGCQNSLLGHFDMKQQVSASYFAMGARRSSKATGQMLGINSHPTGGTYTGEVKAAGTKLLRLEFKWNQIESKPGVYDFSPTSSAGASLRALDEALSTAGGARRVKPIVVLDGSNPNYGANKTFATVVPDDPANAPQRDQAHRARIAFSKFASWLAAFFDRRYGAGVVNTFEVWNEWNIGNSDLVLGGCCADPASYPANAHDLYTDLLCHTHDELNPNGASSRIVLAGATSNVPGAFFEGIFRHGAARCLSGVSVHPYSLDIANGGRLQCPSGGPSMDFDAYTACRLTTLHTMLSSWSGGKDIPIYVTEDSVGNVDEATQTAYLNRLLGAVRPLPFVKAFVWYKLQEESGRGLLNGAGAPKTSLFKAFQGHAIDF